MLRDAVERNCWLSAEFQVVAEGRDQRLLLLSVAPMALGRWVDTM